MHGVWLGGILKNAEGGGCQHRPDQPHAIDLTMRLHACTHSLLAWLLAGLVAVAVSAEPAQAIEYGLDRKSVV